ncbi:hypothetical protein EAE96_011124 [Botrytis aclada]|nr:hypothetical protein EAE96_011124 [Botrytis aclada]
MQFGAIKKEDPQYNIGSISPGHIGAQGHARINFTVNNNNHNSESKNYLPKTIRSLPRKKEPDSGYFEARKVEFDAMIKMLETPSIKGSPMRYVMWGTAGVGKTQLVYRYLNQLWAKDQFPLYNIIWLKASNSAAFDESIEHALQKINWQFKFCDNLKILDGRSILANWLEECLVIQPGSRYILVLDDVREETWICARDIIPPKDSTWQVIVTTRSCLIADRFTPSGEESRCREIEAFDTETAEKIFVGIWKAMNQQRGHKVDKKKAAEIVEAVGCLPLGIEIAVRRARDIGLTDVWQSRKNALDWKDEISVYKYHQHPQGHHERIFKNAFDHFWDLSTKPESAETKLFHELSFFNANVLEMALFKEVLRHIESLMVFMKDLEPREFEYLKIKLLKIKDSIFDVLWERGRGNDVIDAAREAFNMREEYLGYGSCDNINNLNIYVKALLRRGLYLEAWFEMDQALKLKTVNPDRDWLNAPVKETEEIFTFLDNVAISLRYKGESGKATSQSEYNVSKGDQWLGSKHPYFMRSRMNLVLAYQSEGLYDKAFNLVRYLETKFSEDDNGPDALDSRDCHASVLYYKGFYDKARLVIEKVLNTRRNILGVKVRTTLSSFHTYAKIQMAQGDYHSALRSVKLAYHGRKEILGSDHLDTILSDNSLTLLYLKIGEYRLAYENAEDLLNRSRKVFIENYPANLNVMRTFATACRFQGDYNEAVKYYRRCYDLRKDELRAGHPQTLASLKDTGWCLSVEGNYKGARDIYFDVYQKQCMELGEEHTETLATLSSLSVIHGKLGKYKEGMDAAWSAWSLQEKILGLKHPDTLTSIHNYAVILRYKRLDKDSAFLSQYVWKQRLQTLGDRHLDTLASGDNHAQSLQCLGNYKEAEIIYEQGRLLRRELFGNEQHPETSKALHAYSSLLRMQNQAKEARDLWELTSKKQENSSDCNEELLWNYNHGLILHLEKRFDEAFNWIENVLKQQSNLLGDDHPDTLSSLHQLGVFKLEREAYEESEVILKRTFEVRKTLLGSEHPDTLATLSCYCLAVVQQKKFGQVQGILDSDLYVKGGSKAASKPILFKFSEDLPYFRTSRYLSEKLDTALSGYDLLDSQNIMLAIGYLKRANWEEAEHTLRRIKSHPDKDTMLRLSFIQQALQESRSREASLLSKEHDEEDEEDEEETVSLLDLTESDDTQGRATK